MDTIFFKFLAAKYENFSPGDSRISFLFVFVVLVVTFKACQSTKKPKSSKGFDEGRPQFNASRLKAFPPPFPNGWYMVCSRKELEKGDALSISALGREFVAFLGRENGDEKQPLVATVLDAHCPHLGAHLGVGSSVDLKHGTITCPFHGWTFDSVGKVTKIPYTCSKIPAVARTHAWRVRELLGNVYMWFHAEENEPPYWEVDPPLELSNIGTNKSDWRVVQRSTSHFSMHVAEMVENSADYFHFNYLHVALPLPLLRYFVTVEHDVKTFFPGEPTKTHTCYSEEYAELYVHLPIFGKIHLPLPRTKTVITFEGPSIIHFNMKTAIGSMRMINHLLPLRPFELHTETAWYAERSVPTWLVYIIAEIAKGALEQDRLVWESKSFANKPILVQGDGPFSKHRRWFSQFYSENSRSAANANKNAIDW